MSSLQCSEIMYYDPTEDGFHICHDRRYKRGRRVPKSGSFRQRRARKGVAPRRGPRTGAVGVSETPADGVHMIHGVDQYGHPWVLRPCLDSGHQLPLLQEGSASI